MALHPQAIEKDTANLNDPSSISAGSTPKSPLAQKSILSRIPTSIKSVLTLYAIVSQALLLFNTWIVNPRNYGSYPHGEWEMLGCFIIFAAATQLPPRYCLYFQPGVAFLWIGFVVFAGLFMFILPNSILDSMEGSTRPITTFFAGGLVDAVGRIWNRIVWTSSIPLLHGAFVELMTTRTSDDPLANAVTPFRFVLILAAAICNAGLTANVNVIPFQGIAYAIRSDREGLPGTDQAFWRYCIVASYMFCSTASYGLLPLFRQRLYKYSPNMRVLVWHSWTHIELIPFKREDMKRREEDLEYKPVLEQIRSYSTKVSVVSFQTMIATAGFVVLATGGIPKELLLYFAFVVLVPCTIFNCVGILIRSRWGMSLWMKRSLQLIYALYLILLFTPWVDPFGWGETGLEKMLYGPEGLKWDIVDASSGRIARH